MRIGDLVTLKEAWGRQGVSSFGIIIDLGCRSTNLSATLATVRWSNGMQTHESSLGLKVLSEF